MVMTGSQGGQLDMRAPQARPATRRAGHLPDLRQPRVRHVARAGDRYAIAAPAIHCSQRTAAELTLGCNFALSMRLGLAK